jgi:hypothetical protein
MDGYWSISFLDKLAIDAQEQWMWPLGPGAEGSEPGPRWRNMATSIANAPKTTLWCDF